MNKFYFLFFVVLIGSTLVLAEFANEDEPPCRDNCDSVVSAEKNSCLKSYMEFYAYKLVKSIFNYAKISVYAGLWATRYEKADLGLFENIFMKTLEKYQDKLVLGNVEFSDLNRTALFIFEQFKNLTIKRDQSNAFKYETYPSLRCPVPCNYELVTWQTLFYVSLAIFILALVTILFYSVFLRKQYVSLRNRLKNSKYLKSNAE